MNAARIPVANAAENAASRELVNDMVAQFRMAIAPMMMDDPDAIPAIQSMAMTAAALFAGATCGHMIAVGAMAEGDKARAVKVMTVNFRNGIEMGKREARKAILEQAPVEGSA